MGAMWREWAEQGWMGVGLGGKGRDGVEDNNSSNLSSLSSDSSLDTGSWLSNSDSDKESMDTFLPNLPDGLADQADTCLQSSHDNSDVDVGWDGDDEADGLGTGDHNSSRNVRNFVIDEIKNMYAHGYEMPRRIRYECIHANFFLPSGAPDYRKI